MQTIHVDFNLQTELNNPIEILENVCNMKRMLRGCVDVQSCILEQNFRLSIRNLQPFGLQLESI